VYTCYDERMRRVPPKELRLRALGGLVELAPGERTASARFRERGEVVEAFLRLDTHRRGEVVRAGLEALGLLEVKDAEAR
jgi:hypothetical protein